MLCQMCRIQAGSSMSGSGVSKYGCVLSSSGTIGSTRVGCRAPRNFKHLECRRKKKKNTENGAGWQRKTDRNSHLNSLPDRVAVGRVLGEVLQEFHEGQLDALFSGHISVAKQLMQGLSNVPRWVLQWMAN